MAKKTKVKFGPGECAYCGQLHDKRTAEHIFPSALFFTPPPDSDRIIVGVCTPCNNEKSKFDGEFRDEMLYGQNAWRHPDARRILRGKHANAVKHNSSMVARSINDGWFGVWKSPSGLLIPDQLRAESDPVPVAHVIGHAACGLITNLTGQTVATSHAAHIREVDKSEFHHRMEVINDHNPKHLGIEGGHVVQWGGLVYSNAGSPWSAYECVMRFYRSRAFHVMVVPNLDMLATP